MIAQEGQQLTARIVAFDDGVTDVRPVEAGDELRRTGKAEAVDDLLPGRGVGGRRQGDARHLRVTLVQGRKLDVLGAEIVPPLRDTVRLVDGEEGDPSFAIEAVEEAEEALAEQALGCHIDEVELAGKQAALGLAQGVEVERRIDEGRAHPGLKKRVDLILHQRDQRRNDDPHPRTQQGRNLVAQRLAAAGRHQHQRIAAVRHVLDDLLLLPAEGGIAENALQDVVGKHGGAECRRSGREKGRGREAGEKRRGRANGPGRGC